MKRVLILILLINNVIFAQDVIIKKNGDEVKSKILEITSSEIKYKEFDFQNGPTRNISVSEVFMIIYENGKRETINKKEVTNTEVTNTKVSNSEYKGKYFMLGAGYGNSYGGSGVRVQWRTGDIQGFGWHAGVGYLPTGEGAVLASAGLKFFPYKDLYINAQFGLVGYEQTYDYYYGYSYDSEYLYGPSMLLGGDWTWGGKVGFGFNAGAGLTYNLNSGVSDDLLLAIDLGFLIRF